MPVVTPTIARTRNRTSPLALWHLLSLDAPTIAVLWSAFIAASVGITLPAAALVAMFLAVWMLYAADRLLDARLLDASTRHIGDLEHRHRFHHLHRSGFLVAIAAASIALAILIPRLHPGALHLYLVLGTLLAGYFILIHATGSGHRLPKEIAVGLFFSAAVFIPTIARAPNLRPGLLPAALLFALLCSLNCLFIYRWEHPHSHRSISTPHPATRAALRHLGTLAGLGLLANLLLLALSLRLREPNAHPIVPSIPAACALSIAALLLLHRRRHHLSPVHLRAAADLALLTPFLLLPMLRSVAAIAALPRPL